MSGAEELKAIDADPLPWPTRLEAFLMGLGLGSFPWALPTLSHWSGWFT